MLCHVDLAFLEFCRRLAPASLTESSQFCFRISPEDLFCSLYPVFMRTRFGRLPIVWGLPQRMLEKPRKVSSRHRHWNDDLCILKPTVLKPHCRYNQETARPPRYCHQSPPSQHCRSHLSLSDPTIKSFSALVNPSITRQERVCQLAVNSLLPSFCRNGLLPTHPS